MADKRNAAREIPKHDIHVKASVEESSLMKDLLSSAMEEYIVPKSTELLRDTFTGMIGMAADALRGMVDKVLYPNGDAPTRKTSNQGSSYYTSTTNYTSFSRPIGQYQPQRGRDMIGQRPGNLVKKIWVANEDIAKQIVGALIEDIDNYNKAKVATLYEMIGERTTMVDYHYGWPDEHINAIGYFYDTDRRPDEDRWYIDLPKPVDITNR